MKRYGLPDKIINTASWIQNKERCVRKSCQFLTKIRHVRKRGWGRSEWVACPWEVLYPTGGWEAQTDVKFWICSYKRPRRYGVQKRSEGSVRQGFSIVMWRMYESMGMNLEVKKSVDCESSGFSRILVVKYGRPQSGTRKEARSN